MTSDKRVILSIVLGAILVKLILFGWAYYNFDFSVYPYENWLSIWDRWDSKAYLTIAAQWYTPTDVAPDYRFFLSHFPPLYPMLISSVSTLSFIPPLQTGMLISLAAIVLASVFLYKLVKLDFDERTAILSVVFLNIYPVSYFTQTVYTESLYILLAVLLFYSFRQERMPGLTGILSGAGILIRLSGIALAPAHVAMIWKRYGFKLKHYIHAILWPALSISLYILINKIYFGSPAAFLQEYASNPYTSKLMTIPFKETITTFIELIENLFAGKLTETFMMTLGWSAVFTLFALTATLFGIKKLPAEYTVFSLASLILFSSFTWGISNARYTLPLFPIFIALAQIKNRYTLCFTMAVFIFLLLRFTAVFTSGGWAF